MSSSFSNMKSMVMPARTHGYSASQRERECLARAMFFESNRSSRDGLVAVGSVVMNRKESGKWGDDICDVVGAKRQVAPGVLSRPMNSKALPDVMDAADAVLKGERHPKVTDDVMFFHTAGLKFPYKNMRYTTVAGGNAFYYKADRKQDRLPVKQDDSLSGMQPVMVAQAAEPVAEPQALPGVKAEAMQPVQVAYADDTPNKPQPVRTSLFGKRKAQPVEQMAPPQSVAEEPSPAQDGEIRIALADEAPIPMQRAEPQFEPQQTAFSASPDNLAPTKKLKLKRQQPIEPVQAASYEAPSNERFGGAMPAFNGSGGGLSDGDGMGTGVLGKLLIQGN